MDAFNSRRRDFLRRACGRLSLVFVIPVVLDLLALVPLLLPLLFPLLVLLLRLLQTRLRCGGGGRSLGRGRPADDVPLGERIHVCLRLARAPEAADVFLGCVPGPNLDLLADPVAWCSIDEIRRV